MNSFQDINSAHTNKTTEQWPKADRCLQSGLVKAQILFAFICRHSFKDKHVFPCPDKKEKATSS